MFRIAGKTEDLTEEDGDSLCDGYVRQEGLNKVYVTGMCKRAAQAVNIWRRASKMDQLYRYRLNRLCVRYVTAMCKLVIVGRETF